MQPNLGVLPDDRAGKAAGKKIQTGNGSHHKERKGLSSNKEDQLDVFLENTPAAVAMFDTEMRYIAASERWLQDYSLGNIDLIGKSHYEVFPEIPERWKAIHRRCLGGAIESCEEDPFPRLDGSVDWVRWTVRPWRDANGSIGGLIMFTEVITERKLERERLRMSLMQLRHKTRELEAINKELDAFSYSVSHDLRAPLTLIGGFVNFLEENNVDQLDVEGKRCVENISTSIRRMNNLIDDLLNLSRLTASELDFQTVDIGAISQEIVSELRRFEDERSVDVTIDDDLVVVADGRLLRIAMDNLLRNAWKFTEEEEKAKIHVGKTVNNDGEEIYFVEDNGIGFDMSRAEDLFLPFSRLHTGKYEGDGIGLATVQRVIFRHGGRIFAEGELGKGATFKFSLG